MPESALLSASFSRRPFLGATNHSQQLTSVVVNYREVIPSTARGQLCTGLDTSAKNRGSVVALSVTCVKYGRLKATVWQVICAGWEDDHPGYHGALRQRRPRPNGSLSQRRGRPGAAENAACMVVRGQRRPA
jgi:hypothetical protein